MKSWWELGEGVGYQGDSLSTYDIVCPFCLERGQFAEVFHVEKRKPNSGKKLNFDTVKCTNCAGYVQVVWSAGEFGGHLHNFRVQPWPLKVGEAPKHWPAEVRRCWQQAHRSLESESWDAAAVMARSALQATLRQQGAKGNNLKGEINDLASKGILPPLMREWSDEVRVLAADAAHPDGEST